ncbi:hypothetical protein GCM10007082_11420 [Oceanisphaera arctica]|nr:hypothetical protein GCM10007082_11420 [Oceanisphaera arctica]
MNQPANHQLIAIIFCINTNLLPQPAKGAPLDDFYQNAKNTDTLASPMKVENNTKLTIKNNQYHHKNSFTPIYPW